MLAKLFTYSSLGIEAKPVEVDISPGAMPKTILVGLAEAAVRESIHRVERSLVNSGYTRPVDRIVINLSPADQGRTLDGLDNQGAGQTRTARSRSQCARSGSR